MPRCARVKSYDSMYHVMVRSISDTLLFKCGSDKDMYLRLIGKYQCIFNFRVYAYCIMDTHAHILIDCNGADISKIMHCINQCYAQYFNRVYKRHGHLFQDRFKSKIVEDNLGLLRLSAYIHCNPDEIKGYEGKWQQYVYSSMGVYLGSSRDDFHILDTDFILNLCSKDIILARINYYGLVKDYSEKEPIDDVEFLHERSEYRSERTILIRDAKPSDIVNFVASYIRKDGLDMHVKYIHEASDMKALSAFMMRELCDMKLKDIGKEIGNVSETYISKLCLKGYRLICENERYREMVKEFLKQKAS
jgi:REP element-mobilizing transposase RayT